MWLGQKVGRVTGDDVRKYWGGPSGACRPCRNLWTVKEASGRFAAVGGEII